jgi:hypothetical protein
MPAKAKKYRVRYQCPITNAWRVLGFDLTKAEATVLHERTHVRTEMMEDLA